jgi:citrate lyase subunit beta/citryl-CoA lyase
MKVEVSQAMASWRSLLFVPGDVKKFIDAAPRQGADAILIDLEDGVSPENKAAARTALPATVDFLVGQGLDVLVRVNRPIHLCGLDLQAVIRPGVKAIVIPKVTGPGHLKLVADTVAEIEVEVGLELGSISLIALIESPGAFFNLAEIVSATTRLKAVAFGSEDLAAELGISPTTDLLFQPCQQLVFAARSAGLYAFGFPGSIAEIDDDGLFRQSVRKGLDMGFDGALCIHPKQVRAVNEIFTPSDKQIDDARKIVEAFEEAQQKNIGVVKFRGRMIDQPVYARSSRLLDKARAVD